MSFVAWFGEARSADTGSVGGKGANLGELTSATFPVPLGFIVTTSAYWQVLDAGSTRKMIAKCLGAIRPDERMIQASISDEIKGLVEAAEIPAEVAAEIERACATLGAGPFAVRSSATAEDLAEASFAGQQATLLNVWPSEALGAVRTCWASLFEAHAIAYRASKGIDHLSTGMAVVVQQMVQAERSGVMFTVHPVTGDAGMMVIEAAYGLGEAIVSGIVTPDTYVVEKGSFGLKEKDVNRQDRKLVMNPAPREGEEANTWLDIPVAEAGAQKLSDAQIAAIAELGARIEAHYGSPQDIEWAEKDGSFFILQARPVTAGI